MVPIAGDVFAVVERVEDDRRERFFDETVRRLGTDVQTLAMLADDGSLAELWLRGCKAAGAARTQEKLRLLAGVVAAAQAGERVDVPAGHALLGVIESLEAVHIQLLLDVHGESQKDPQPLEDGSQGRRGARPDALEGLTSLHPDILAAVLNDLAAKQLIWNAWERTYAGLRGVVAYVLTDLGEQVRRLLDAAAEEHDPAATAP